jgi:excisionase family DNA binding protein
MPRDGGADMLTIDQVAAYFQVSTRTVSRWLESGRLPAVRVGNVTRIHREDLRAFVASNASGGRER